MPRLQTGDLDRPVVSLAHAVSRVKGLDFGLYIIVTPDDRYVFLEVNPNGQWQWIERATGFPICETLVDLLVAGEAAR
jgi:glutathione synthase/RimK-type ligase-like ATP-grasp enzyme